MSGAQCGSTIIIQISLTRLSKVLSESILPRAGVVFDYYKGKFKRDYAELVRETDKIDSAELSMDEVSCPEKYPYILLSMTVSNRSMADEQYLNRLILLLKKQDITDVMKDPEVKERCAAVVDENKIYKSVLTENTILKGQVSITDLRSFDKTPEGNRFLVYSLYPEAVVSVRIKYDDASKEKNGCKHRAQHIQQEMQCKRRRHACEIRWRRAQGRRLVQISFKQS